MSESFWDAHGVEIEACTSSKHFAAAMILATDALARQLVPPGFECCEQGLLGRPWRRDGGLRDIQAVCRILDPAWKPLWDIMAEPHELPGRPGRRDWGVRKFRRFFRLREIIPSRSKL